MTPTRSRKRKRSKRAAPNHAPRSVIATPDHLLNLNDVAQRLDVSVMTVRRLIERKDLDCIRIGRQIRFTHDHIKAFIDSRNAKAQTQP
jgi:excisionase family DNA binding protein